MDVSHIEVLLKHYLAREISEPELSALEAVLTEDQQQDYVVTAIDKVLSQSAPDDTYDPEKWEPVLEKIIRTRQQDSHTAGRVVGIKRFRWVAAAVLVGLIGWGVWWITVQKPSSQSPLVAGPTVPQILPGQEGAILTLGDGKHLLLDSLGNGTLFNTDGTKVELRNGELLYEGGAQSKTESTSLFHTMTTPKGRQFALVLPDGTKAWLNAASSIKYPIQFGAYERRVEITGEVYFEVAKMARLPFRVQVDNRAAIEVLGTHFNVNAYEERPGVQTSLLEGSVRVSSREARSPAVIIKPGQQALVNEKVTVFDNVDMVQVMAWKNGLFHFENASMREVMGQLTRWYDIDVVYPNGIPEVTFGGKMSRNVPLSDVLKALKGFGINYRMEANRKLVITP